MSLTVERCRPKPACFEALIKLKLLELATKHLSGESEQLVMKGLMDISNYYPSKLVDGLGAREETQAPTPGASSARQTRFNALADAPAKLSLQQASRKVEWTLRRISKSVSLRQLLGLAEATETRFDFYSFERLVCFSACFLQRELEDALVASLFGLMSLALVDVAILGLEETFAFITTLSQSDALSKRSLKKNLVAKKLLESSLMDQSFFKEAVLMSCKKLVSMQYSARLSKLVDFAAIVNKVARDCDADFCKVLACILKILLDYFQVSGSIFLSDRAAGGLLENAEAVSQAGASLVLVVVRDRGQVCLRLGTPCRNPSQATAGTNRQESAQAKVASLTPSNPSSPNLSASPNSSSNPQSATNLDTSVFPRLQDFLSKTQARDSPTFSLRKQRTSEAQIATIAQASQSPRQASAKRLKLKPIQHLSNDILNKSKTNKHFMSKILRQASKNSSSNQSRLKDPDPDQDSNPDPDPCLPSQESTPQNRRPSRDLASSLLAVQDPGLPASLRLGPDLAQLRTQASLPDREARTDPFQPVLDAAALLPDPALPVFPVEPLEATKTVTVERCYRVKRYEEDPEITKIINKYRSAHSQSQTRAPDPDRSPGSALPLPGFPTKPQTLALQEAVQVSPFAIYPGSLASASTTPLPKPKRFEKTEMLKKICRFADLVDSNSKKLSYNIRDPDHKPAFVSGSFFPASDFLGQRQPFQTPSSLALASPSLARNFAGFSETARHVVFGANAADSSPSKKIDRVQPDPGLSERHARPRPQLASLDSQAHRGALHYSYQRPVSDSSLQDRSLDFAPAPGFRAEEAPWQQPRLRTLEAQAYGFQHFSGQASLGLHTPTTHSHKYK